jgi:hypothetical protein
MNRIFIQFSENVTIGPGGIELFGVAVPDYSSRIDTISYDSDSHLATVKLKPEFVFEADKLLVRVNETVVDDDDIPIEEYLFRINVVPGDADRNTLVASSDITTVRSGRLKFIGVEGYTIYSDLDGTSLINTGDITLARSKRLTFLPSSEPTPPAIALAAEIGVLVDLVLDDEGFQIEDFELGEYADTLVAADGRTKI